MRFPDRNRGVTLLELLVVLAIIGILVAVGSWGSAGELRRWQAWRGAQQILTDLRTAQAHAERRGSHVLAEGGLAATRSFLVFEPEARRYALLDWQDRDGNGRPDEGESRRIWMRDLPPGVRFGRAAGVDRKACGNAAGAPSADITFGTAGYPPCSGQPCLKFDPQGFSTMGPGGIYLIDGAEAYALTATRPGHFTLCRWDGSRWR